MPTDWWDPDVQATVSAVIADREKNLNAIKPGVQTMFLIFSSRTYDRVWELPLYTTYFKQSLEPLVEALIGRESMSNIIRLQLARMTPGAHIKAHRDTGPWASEYASATSAKPLLVDGKTCLESTQPRVHTDACSDVFSGIHHLVYFM